MKYLLFACSMILLDAISCGSRHNEPDYLKVKPNVVTLDNRWNSCLIQVYSNMQWRIATDVSWLEVSPLQGNSDATITVTAQPNESTSSRSCILIIIGEDMQREVRVYQEGKTIVDDLDGAT